MHKPFNSSSFISGISDNSDPSKESQDRKMVSSKDMIEKNSIQKIRAKEEWRNVIKISKRKQDYFYDDYPVTQG